MEIDDPYKDIIALSKQMTNRELAKHYGRPTTSIWKILDRRRRAARAAASPPKPLPPAPPRTVKSKLSAPQHPDVPCEIVRTKTIRRCHGYDDCPYYSQCLDYAAAKYYRGWIGRPR